MVTNHRNVGGWPEGTVESEHFDEVVYTLGAYDDGTFLLIWPTITQNGKEVVGAGSMRVWPGCYVKMHRERRCLYASSTPGGQMLCQILETAGERGRPWLAAWHPGGVTEIA